MPAVAVPPSFYAESMSGPGSEWIVLLLGGASGVGKSMLSRRLARRLGVNLTEIDDLQVALEAAVAPRCLPLLHVWHTHADEYRSWSDERRATGCALRPGVP
jgi:2-phosphoglycerate kinase